MGTDTLFIGLGQTFHKTIQVFQTNGASGGSGSDSNGDSNGNGHRSISSLPPSVIGV